MHILLPKADLQLLQRRAKAEKKSIGELIRQAVKRVYGVPEPNKKREAFEWLAQRNELVMDDWDQVKKELLKRYE